MVLCGNCCQSASAETLNLSALLPLANIAYPSATTSKHCLPIMPSYHMQQALTAAFACLLGPYLLPTCLPACPAGARHLHH
jgi:hypothetical protein